MTRDNYLRYSGAELTTLRIEGSSSELSLQSSLLLDLLTALTDGILSLKLEGYTVRPSKLSCADSKAWQQGLFYTLAEYVAPVRLEEIEG